MDGARRIIGILLLIAIGISADACRRKSAVDEIAGSWRLDRSATLADPALRNLSAVKKKTIQKRIEALDGLTFVYSPDEVRAEYPLADGKIQSTKKEIVRSLKEPKGAIVIETRNERGGVDRISIEPIDPDHFALPVLNNPDLAGVRLHFSRL